MSDFPSDEYLEELGSEGGELADNHMTESAKEPIPDSADFEPNPVEPAFTPDELAEILGNNPDSAHGLCPHCRRIEPDVDNANIIQINPNSKWVLVLPDDTDVDEARLIAERVQNWWDQVEGYDWPIMILGGSPGLRLVRVDEDEAGPALADCGGMNCPGHVVGEGEERCPTSEERYGG